MGKQDSRAVRAESKIVENDQKCFRENSATL